MPAIPIILILIGIVFVVAGARGKGDEVGNILVADFTAKPSYLAWVASVLIISVIGLAPQTRKLGTAFFALMIIVLFISNRGFFTEFSRQIRN